MGINLWLPCSSRFYIFTLIHRFEALSTYQIGFLEIRLQIHYPRFLEIWSLYPIIMVWSKAIHSTVLCKVVTAVIVARAVRMSHLPFSSRQHTLRYRQHSIASIFISTSSSYCRICSQTFTRRFVDQVFSTTSSLGIGSTTWFLAVVG